MIFSPRTLHNGLPQKISYRLRIDSQSRKYISLLVNRQKYIHFKQSLNRICNSCVVRRFKRGIATNNVAASRRVFVPSTEQQGVVKLCDLQNVIVSARPGAGKTATAEAIVAADRTRPVAVLTYSKRLQLDTAARLSNYPESDAFTFHSLAGRLYSTIVPNDTALRALRRKRNPPFWTGKLYEIIVLDEMQDCTDDIFWLISMFIKTVTVARNGKAPRIVVLGDERQAIYAFKGADPRYLSLASSTMATLSPYPWNHLELSKSFRLSYENTAFVNNAFLGGEKYITGSHSGPQPLYLYANTFDAPSLAQHLIPLIHQYGPESTAVLAPSVRQSRPVQILVNYLSEKHGLLVAEPQSDDGPLDENVLRDKICVSTYHQFKGNERDLVITYGVDASYFIHQAKDLPDDICPNATFVALTRAHKQLVVINDSRQDPMPFVDVFELENTTNIINLDNDEEIVLESGKSGRPMQLGLQLPASVAASELPRHIPDHIVEEICTKHLRIDQILPPLSKALHLDAPAIVLTDPVKKHYEAVSDLNGLAVVAAYEYALLGTLTTLGKTRWLFPKLFSSTKAQAIWLCRESCAYSARVSGYKPRKLQMKNHAFDWLASYLDAARFRLEAQFVEPAPLDFEVFLQGEKFAVTDFLGDKRQTIKVNGRADIIRYEGSLSTTSARNPKAKKKSRKELMKDIKFEEVSIWEIKFVSQLSLEHVIQVCVYAYLWCNTHERELPPRIYLFNVRNGEKWEIVPRKGIASLRAVVEEALIAKYTSPDVLSTDEFLKQCKKTVDEVEKKFRITDV